MLEEKHNIKAWLYLAPAMILLLVFTFYPIFNAFFLVFLRDFNFLSGTFDGFTLTENFVYILNKPDFKKALLNTLMIVFVSVPASVILALLISAWLNSVKKFQGFFQTIFFLPYVTNAIAIGMAFAFLFHQDFGLINTMFEWIGIPRINWVGMGAGYWSSMFALLVFIIWSGLAFKIMVFLSGLQSIDKQYYDAAKVDSTPRSRIFTKITVPLLSPMIAYITITSIIGAFKEYTAVIGMFGVRLGPAGNDGALVTIVALVYEAIGRSGSDGAYSEAAAASIILFAITLVFTLINMQVSKKRVHF